MKVIYLHQYFNTSNMSGGTRSYEMAKRLVAAGHEVSMVTSWRQQTDKKNWFMTEEAGIKVYWLPVPYSNRMNYIERIKAFLKFAWSSARKAASLEGDVVFATSTPLTIAIPAIYTSWKKKIPMVFEVRDMWPAVPIALGIIRNPLLIRLAYWLEQKAYNHSSHIIALAPGMREDIIASGVAPTKISVIPNGCDLDVFSSVSTAYSPRDIYPWLGSRKLVLCAGTVGKVHKLDYLVHLAEQVYLSDPEIRFVVIGDGGEWEKIQSIAIQAGIFEKNFFMFSALPKYDLVTWLHTATIIVSLITGLKLLYKDAVQNKFFDALAVGKPIACNFDGFQSQVAVESDIGLILDPINIGVAADQLISALNNKDWLDAVPNRAKILAEGRFNRDHLAAELERILVDVVAKTSEKSTEN
mgnify:CR=1 FL=1